MRVSALVLLAFALVGCGWFGGDKGYFRDRSDDYRKAETVPVLAIPEDRDGSALQDLYVIPVIAEDIRVTGSFEAPRPLPLVAGASSEVVRIQRLGEEQWILVSFAPGQLWPQVRAYLTQVGIPLARIEASDGLMETDWTRFEEDQSEQRYRFRIEQGVQRNTAELHVLQMYRSDDDGSWPETSVDREQEDAMLMKLAQYVADNVDQTPVSMMAQQSISSSGRVSMQEDAAGNPSIRLELPFYRAWASLDRAINDSSFDITDRNLSEKRYFMRYVESSEDGEGGWFGWLFGRDKQARELEEHGYRLQLEEAAENAVLITIHREDGEALAQEQAQAILVLIKGNIS